MKILQVTHRFYPSSGGGAYVVYNISKYLQNQGNEVTIITSDYNFDKDYANELKKIGVNILPFPRDFSISHFIIARGMKKWLKENIKYYDIIHLHSVRTYQNNQVIKYAKKYDIPIILHAHGSIERIGNKKSLKKMYDKLFLKNIINTVSTFLSLSESEKDAHIRMGVPLNKINIIPNGVNVSEYKNLPKEGIFKKKYGISQEKQILLYIGRIDKSKGIDLLIKAYNDLIQKNKSLILVIAGLDTGYKKELLKIISNLKLGDEVLFVDYISESDKICAFVDSTIFITPRFYGFPITFVEACAFGLPIVTTDGGDYLEWINDYVGFCTKFDEKELAQSISKIIDDVEMRTHFSSNGKEIVESAFNWKNISGNLEKIYIENI